MRTPLLVSEQEYLKSTYQPDREYDEGEVQGRNLGERPHSILQGEFFAYFHNLRKQLRVRAFVEQHIRIFSTPPFIAIEILSPEDTMSRVRKKIDEYLAFGVPYIWLVDPYRRRADVYTPSRIDAPEDLILRTENPTMEVPLAELFHAIDE